MTNYKLSYYTIFTEEVSDSKDIVVFCSRTSKALIISDSVKECLENDEIDEIPEELREKLINAKVLVPEDENELEVIINENKELLDRNSVLYEIIQPSAMCQLGCYYCGQEHTKDYLDNKLIDLIYQRVQHKLENGKFSRLIIGWFGAEPLMGLKQMRILTKKLMALCQEKGIPYSGKVVTNGLSLKRNIYFELANQLNIDSIEITLDGTAEYHDKHRYLKNGGKSFDLILENLIEIVHDQEYDPKKCNITLRCNVDTDNVEGVIPLVDLLNDTGVMKKVARFYEIGIYSWGDNDAHKNSLTKEEFAKKQILWHMYKFKYTDKPTPIGLPKRKKMVCMTVDKNAEMIDAFGNQFNCTEVSYVPEYDKSQKYVLGNINNDVTTDFKEQYFEDWNDIVLKNEFPCTKCKMLPVCGGACPKSWYDGNPACPPNKFNIREKLELYYIMAKFENEALNDKLEEFKIKLEDGSCVAV